MLPLIGKSKGPSEMRNEYGGGPEAIGVISLTGAVPASLPRLAQAVRQRKRLKCYEALDALDVEDVGLHVEVPVLGKAHLWREAGRPLKEAEQIEQGVPLPGTEVHQQRVLLRLDEVQYARSDVVDVNVITHDLAIAVNRDRQALLEPGHKYTNRPLPAANRLTITVDIGAADDVSTDAVHRGVKINV